MIDALTVLHEDAHLLAVLKPAGVLTQGKAPGEPTLEDAVRTYLSPADPAAAYLGTVHRLDRPVSGVVVWALNPKAARRLAAQFAGRETIKEYWAIHETAPGIDVPAPGVEGVWDDLLVDTTDAAGVVRIAVADDPRGRRAVTRFRREPSSAHARLPEGLIWLRLWPETGRTHQIRAQAATHGLPVWGDARYGAARPFATGIALHARSLSFRHPSLGNMLTVSAPPPPSWASEGVALRG